MSRRARAALVVAGLCANGALTAACSNGGGGNNPDGSVRRDSGLGPDAGMWWATLRELSFDPPEATLQGSPEATVSQNFTVTGVFADGRRADVTELVSYTVDPATVGTMRAGTFTSSRITGGETRVTARAGTVTATARVTVHWTASATAGADVPADVAARFASAAMDTGTAVPRVVYPYNNTLFPPNISNLEVQWTPPAGAGDFYDITFSNPTIDVHLYTRCATVGTGCGVQLPSAVWHWISEANRGGQGAIETRVRALLANGRVSPSTPVQLRFAASDIEGGIYYWTAAGNANGIYRYNFLEGDRAPQAFYTQPDTPRNSEGAEHSCTGCHALSLDGRRLATVLGGGHVGDVVMLDVATRRPIASKIERWAQLLSFSPDSNRLIGARDGVLRLLNADTLDAIATLETGGLATHPEWSPTNNGVAFTRPINQNNGIYVHRGEIAWLPISAAGAFGTAQSLVAPTTGENHYYPSVTPDGRFVVYNRSVCPGGDEGSDTCDAYDDGTAELWMVDTDLPTHHAVTLASANAQGPTDTMPALTNSWPRVSPFTSRLGAQRVYWLTFSSKRNYGVRLVGQNRPQLWMVAVTVPDGEIQEPLSGDPSFAPFWLPFQDINMGNHIAQWTTSIVTIGAAPPPGFVPPPSPAPARRH